MAEIRYARSKDGKVVVRLAQEREGALFVSVSSKRQATALASEIMGVGPFGEELAALLRKVADAPDDEKPTEPAGKGAKTAGA